MARLAEKKILVIDDEPDVREFLCACLTDAGFKVETATDGFDALEKMKKRVPDLITLDMIMPRISGIKFTREIRKNKQWKNIPLLIVTAHAKDDLGKPDMESLHAEEVSPFPEHIMEKPISPTKLIHGIARILNVESDLEPYVDRAEILATVRLCSPEKLREIQNVLS